MAETHPLVLIDLSSIAHPLFHLSAAEPDPNWTSARIVERIRGLASGQPHVAICVDGPRSRAIRKAIDPTYKAQRDTAPEALFHQIKLAIEALRGDGLPIWEAEGYEADDVIASAVHRIRERCIVIVSADKDLLALIDDMEPASVKVKSLKDGSLLDSAAVIAKFGVTPAQIPDYLALVGDASDNIKGAKGIGAVKAAQLLTAHGTLDKLMTPEVSNTLTPGIRDSLIEFADRCDVVRQLVALRTDVSVNIAEAFETRVVADERDDAADLLHSAETMQSSAMELKRLQPKPPYMMPTQTSEAAQVGTVADQGEPESRVDRGVDSGSVDKVNTPEQDEVNRAIRERQAAMRASAAPQAALVPQVMPAPAPAEWTMQLEPRCLEEAKNLATILHSSRLFSAYGSAPAVLSTILAGRELGLQAMASLRAFHIIEGRPTLSAGIIQAMVIKSPTCEYFRCIERTAERATFATKRKGDPELTLTFTFEEAKTAGVVKQGSGWMKNPADMCVARAATKLARLVYPDICSGLYAPEEF